MSISDQRKLIEEKEWDTLIVLDACRYDFFEKAYDDYLEGELRKVISAGSNTPEWLEGTFKNRDYEDDVVYISGNPVISSRSSKIIRHDFLRIYDVWDWGWNETWRTVLPSTVGKVTRLARAKNPSCRMISHFIQPHVPYFSLDPGEDSIGGKISGFLEKIINRLLRWLNLREIRSLMGLKPAGRSMRLIAKKYGNDELIKAYKKNLETVLEEIAKLTERLPGKVVVTSDHGEFLGEEYENLSNKQKKDFQQAQKSNDRVSGGEILYKNGKRFIYDHPIGVYHPLLREVPWLEAEN